MVSMLRALVLSSQQTWRDQHPNYNDDGSLKKTSYDATGNPYTR